MPIIEGIQYVYTIRPGDTLYSISQRFNSQLQLLEQTNAMFPPFDSPSPISPGQLVVVAESGVGHSSNISYIVSPGDNLYSIGQRFSASPDLMAAINPQIMNVNLIYAGVPLNIPAFIFEIDNGQSLYQLSRQMGIPLSVLIMVNQDRPGFTPEELSNGYRLIVPLPLSHHMIVSGPLPGSRIQQGQVIEGIATASDAIIEYQVRDDHGVIVTKKHELTTFSGTPAYSSFMTALEFDQTPTTAGGEIWVYMRNANDRRIIELVQVRVYFG